MESGQLDVDGVMGVDGFGDAVQRLICLCGVGTQEMIPKHQNLAEILIDVFGVASMVDAVVGWSGQQKVEYSKLSNDSGVLGDSPDVGADTDDDEVLRTEAE